ncbi:MAG: L-lactate dehydrogenase (cytochrome)/(S)-mandelate dehydrogenase [Alphaproteobacteria bacterium]|jgi:(S)-mandelate dehydrogenase
MSVTNAVNIDDLRKMAKRRLPKIAFDFIEGGVEDESGLQRNESAYSQHRIVPKYMVDNMNPDQKTTLFGREYDSPFGIAPTGAAALFRPGADMMLAEAAVAANIPFIMSGAATDSIENLAKVAPEHGWYQLYTANDKPISEDMIRRAADAGLSTLVVTVDVPVRPRRERNIRNGFTRPLKMTLATKLEALRHPGWLMDYYKHGRPILSNWAQYAPAGATADEVANFVTTQTTASLTWDDIERFRRLWPRNFVLKGVMHPDDAFRAAELGVDGIMVSNHGARQLDRAPAPLDVFPAIKAAVDDRMTLMMDGGVRRGADIIVALCLGVEFLFMGRPTLYGAAAGGRIGASRAAQILHNEIKINMRQMGVQSLDQLGPECLMWEDLDDLRRNITKIG